MPQKDLTESDRLRAEYLVLCEQLIEYTKKMRNFAMKSGNAWLARAELAKISSLAGEMESLLDDIKRADNA